LEFSSDSKKEEIQEHINNKLQAQTSKITNSKGWPTDFKYHDTPAEDPLL